MEAERLAWKSGSLILIPALPLISKTDYSASVGAQPPYRMTRELKQITAILLRPRFDQSRNAGPSIRPKSEKTTQVFHHIFLFHQNETIKISSLPQPVSESYLIYLK